jgi:hypothetical protein
VSAILTWKGENMIRMLTCFVMVMLASGFGSSVAAGSLLSAEDMSAVSGGCMYRCTSTICPAPVSCKFRSQPGGFPYCDGANPDIACDNWKVLSGLNVVECRTWNADPLGDQCDSSLHHWEFWPDPVWVDGPGYIGTCIGTKYACKCNENGDHKCEAATNWPYIEEGTYTGSSDCD